ncbi:DUF72 domain-containing protein [Roseateles amylovorans]|uniref:DUF72 domain-containing protein n=1 Tax=Roseateles amylovorans TaxID=2978473 RepID=A0ABY6B6P3_9BURK|nr:DUF72 domain-containing protein [Roseateles amylovorans]UXH80847.1 DUF72 domain-containing protein [Roseateles amylovorans]
MDDLPHPESASAPPPKSRTSPAKRPRAGIVAQPPDDETVALAAALSPNIRLGTSSWGYPGWQGLVWVGRHGESNLSRQALSVYAQHPLFRAVSIDRGFYQRLTASQYERYAQQVPADFRFTIKAPSLVTDALVRSEDGRGRQTNEAFLDPRLAIQEFIEPVLQGLGEKAGALVFQLSPLPLQMLDRMPAQLDRLHALLGALPSLRERSPDAVVAVEVRDPEWLTPDFVAILKQHGARYCLGLHPKLPPIDHQLPLLRAMWPGPLVCRWNLHRLHGPFGYEDAQKRYGEYDTLMDPDPDTRAVLAKVIHATAQAGHAAYVTVSNHAEGSAPRSVKALAQALVDEAQAAAAAAPSQEA